MELKKLLEWVTAGFVRTRTQDAEMARDAAVADIALMIAALDGTVRPEELAAYRWIVGRCPGLSDAARRSHLDAAVRKSGHLLLMAQIADYSEDDLLAAFGIAADDVLPHAFAGFSRADMRRAFVLWVAASVADGDFSAVERRAIRHLRSRLTAPDELGETFLTSVERHLRDLSVPERHREAESALDRLVVFSDASPSDPVI